MEGFILREQIKKIESESFDLEKKSYFETFFQIPEDPNLF